MNLLKARLLQYIYIGLILWSGFLITGCIPTTSTTPACDPSQPPTKSTTTPVLGSWQGSITQAAYGSDAMQQMDIHLPDSRDTSSLVFITIHGGAWKTGTNTRTEMDKYINLLKARFPSAAFYNIDYRLHVQNTTINRFPIQENDIHTAVNYVINRSGTDHVSQKIVIVAISAGAHLGLLEAYKYNTANHIKAVAVFAPPADLNDLRAQNFNGTVAGLINSVTGNDSLLMERSNPVRFITAQSPPTITLHGTADYEVDYRQSVLLFNNLVSKNVPRQFETFSCENHVFRSENITAGINLITAFIQNKVH